MPSHRDSGANERILSAKPSESEVSTSGVVSDAKFRLASMSAPVANFRSDKSKSSKIKSSQPSSFQPSKLAKPSKLVSSPPSLAPSLAPSLSSPSPSAPLIVSRKVSPRNASSLRLGSRKSVFKSSSRQISQGTKSFFKGGVLSWQTSSGVRRLAFSATSQRFMFGSICTVGIVLVCFSSFLFYQHRMLAVETRRLSDSAALLRQAHSVLVDGRDSIFSDDYSGLNPDANDKSLRLGSGFSKDSNTEAFSALSLSRKMLSLLSPGSSSRGSSSQGSSSQGSSLEDSSSGLSDSSSADIVLLRDRALIERDLRRTRKSLRASEHRNGTLSLERADLQKKYERLERDLDAHRKDLKFQRVALGDASKRTRAAEDRLSHIETSAFSLLRDLRDVLGADEIVSSSEDPMVAIRDLAETFAHKSNDRRTRLLAYSEYLDYAISGLERTVFSVGIEPSFLEGLGYDISPVASSISSESSISSSSVVSDLVSIGIGGPLSDSDSQSGTPQTSYKQTFSELDSRFERFNSLRRLVSCMPLGHPLRGGGRLVSGYGRRLDPFTKEPAVHYGIDFGSWYDTDVYPGGKGRVTYTGYKSSYGRIVEVSHGCGFQTRYAHLSSISVKIGDEVDFDSVLGKVGNSGRSTGPHLHYEVRLRNSPFDPQPFLRGVRNVF